jgi:hypothetical protein
MNLETDPSVLAVAEFMYKNIPAARLVGVAAGVHALAPLVWGHYQSETVRPVTLSPCDLHRQPAASE